MVEKRELNHALIIHDFSGTLASAKYFCWGVIYVCIFDREKIVQCSAQQDIRIGHPLFRWHGWTFHPCRNAWCEAGGGFLDKNPSTDGISDISQGGHGNMKGYMTRCCFAYILMTSHGNAECSRQSWKIQIWKQLHIWITKDFFQ